MQSSKVLKVIDWTKSFVLWIFRKIKALLWHVLKHPLGSIFWVIKAYLALVFLSVFVACSFGAFANTLDDVSDPKDFLEATKKQSCKPEIVYAPLTDERRESNNQNYLDWQQRVSAYSNSICPPSDNTTRYDSCSRSMSMDYSLPSCNSSVAVPIKRTITSNTNTSSYVYVDGNYKWVANKPYSESQTYNDYFSVSQWKDDDEYQCLNHEYIIGPIKVGDRQLCFKPKPKAQKCWPTGGAWQLVPMYHFSDSGQDNVCALNDNGENCPWKKSFRGSYVPDPKGTIDCDKTPPEQPPKVDCKTGGNGMKICQADPNEKCTTKSEPNKVPVTSCGPTCGYVNGIFACFNEPNKHSNDPNLPDKKPLKAVDDNITDPNKSVADMVKADFKDIFGGAEDRLDNILTTAENSIESNESLLSDLLSSQRDGNTKLSSIDENTNGINENTKGILEALNAEGDIKGGEAPKLEDPKKNEWKTRNFGTIMKAKAEEIQKIPLFTSVKNFFNVSFGGTCPQYSVSVWVFEIQVDQFCSAQMNSLWPYIKAVVLLACSFLAVRIALL